MNIFQIEQELKELFDTLEENGGELTPELEEALAISQTDFVNKIKSYSNVIKQLDADLSAIKCEKDRLKALEDSKKRTKERLSTIMCSAISMFGDTTRSGGKFVDYGTGKASVRNSIICNVDENVANQAVNAIWKKFTFGKQVNNLDLIDLYTADDIQKIVHEYNEGLNINLINQGLEANDEDVTINKDDLDLIDMEISLTLPASKAFEGDTKKILKSLTEAGLVEVKPKVNKTFAKNCIVNDGIDFNVAKVSENQSLIIK